MHVESEQDIIENLTLLLTQVKQRRLLLERQEESLTRQIEEQKTLVTRPPAPAPKEIFTESLPATNGTSGKRPVRGEGTMFQVRALLEKNERGLKVGEIVAQLNAKGHPAPSSLYQMLYKTVNKKPTWLVRTKDGRYIMAPKERLRKIA